MIATLTPRHDATRSLLVHGNIGIQRSTASCLLFSCLTMQVRGAGLATDQLVTKVEGKLAALDSYEQLLGGIALGGGVAAL